MLRPLRINDEAVARAAHEELALEGFAFLLDLRADEPWASYLLRLEALRCGRDIPTDRVPATFLVAEVGEALVGRVSIRHQLNAFLNDFGGHIGFGLLAAHRRHGYATEMLRQALVIARNAGVGPVLLTCDDGNDASTAVIERAGGVLENIRLTPDGIATRRYWIG